MTTLVDRLFEAVPFEAPMFARCATERAVLVLAALLSCAGAQALDPAKSITQYNRDVWRTVEGLPQSSVQAIAQTTDGYLWFGTRGGGLSRFDGVTFTVFHPRETPGLIGTDIRALQAGPQGSLWIATDDGGLTRYEQGTFKTYGVADGLLHSALNTLEWDEAGSLWIGGWRGVNRLQNGTFSSLTTKDGLIQPEVVSIANDREGGLWFGTWGGLTRLHNGRWDVFTYEGGKRIYGAHLYVDRSGTVWAGTFDGLFRIAHGVVTRYTTHDGLLHNRVDAVLEDRHGNLWAGTLRGLNRLRGDRFESDPTGAIDDPVQSLFEDREGSLWIGTRGGGLVRLREGALVTYTDGEGLCKGGVLAVAQTHDGDIWIGCEGGGVTRLHAGQPETYKTGDPAYDTVLALGTDRNGALWIGSRADELRRFKDGRFTIVPTNASLSPAQFIHEDREGTLWIGTLGHGLGQVRNGKARVFTMVDGLTHNLIYDVAENPKGGLWFSTPEGLTRYEGQRFYAAPFTPRNLSFFAMHQDADGVLWAGTSNRGICRLDHEGRIAACYGPAQGLPEGIVYQLFEDGEARFWIGGPQGIFCVRRSDLLAFDERKVESVPYVAYGISDGMKSAECSERRGLADRDGRIWFPTVKGVVVVDPRRIPRNTVAPPVVIESVRVDGKSLDVRLPVTVRPGQREIEIAYAGLSYVAPEKVRFKYRLEGFDEHWVEAGSRRRAFYTNLHPGAYRFRVIACNNDGVWNETGASCAFIIKPRFTQTGWFYAACAGALALIGFGIFELRVRQLRQRFHAILAERTRVAREIHDTLLQDFVGARLELDAAIRMVQSPAEAKEQLRKVTSQISEGLTRARQVIWDLRSPSVKEGDLGSQLWAMVQALAPSDPHREVVVNVSGHARPLPPEVERQMLRIAQEAVRNALKHSQARHIRIHLQYEKESVALAIQDDGRGFEADPTTSAQPGRYGVVGLRERAKVLGGRLLIQSRPGAGTEIQLIVPMS